MKTSILRFAATLALATAMAACSGPNTPTALPTSTGLATDDRAGITESPSSVGAHNQQPGIALKTYPAIDYSTSPYPTISGPASLTVLFNLCKSDDPDQEDSVNWQFHFGDGKPISEGPDFARSCRVEHTYLRDGVYVATLSVTDKTPGDQDDFSGLARATIRIRIVVGEKRAAATQPVLQGGSLTTSLGPNNGCSGTMFDLQAVAGPVTLTGFDVIVSPGVDPRPTEVYFAAQTSVGKETNPGAWSMVLSTTIPNPQSVAVPVRVTIPPTTIPAGQSIGVYINHPGSGARYLTGANTYANANLAFSSNRGLCSTFSGLNFPRTWTGIIHYQY